MAKKAMTLEDWRGRVLSMTGNQAKFEWLSAVHCQAIFNRQCVAEFQKDTWWIADPDGFTIHGGDVLPA